MHHFLNYLIDVSICLVVLSVSYQIFIRNLTFYRLRRTFLISSILISFIIPSLNLKVQNTSLPQTNIHNLLTQPKTPQENLNISESQKQNVPVQSKEVELVAIVKTNPYTLIIIIYMLGVVFLSIKLLLSILSLFRKKKENIFQYEGFKVYLQITNEPACSFFNLIYINPNLFSSQKEIKTAIEHELVHVREKHTMDLILFEVTKIILWFHPMIYLLIKELKTVHEYLADRRMSEKAGKRFYSQMLLNYAQTINQTQLIHSFAQPPLKHRIEQLFRTKTPAVYRIRLLFLIPILTGLFLAFSCEKELDEGLIFTNGKKLKSLKVVYHDEYGDMPTYDGQYYSWAKFTPSGEIQELKKGTFAENSNDDFKAVLNNRHFPIFRNNNIIWNLDYHPISNEIVSLLVNPNWFAKSKLSMSKDYNDSSIETHFTQDSRGLPLKIIYGLRNSSSDNKSFPNFRVENNFSYDHKGRLYEWNTNSQRYFSKDKVEKHSTSSYLKYNLEDKVIQIRQNDLTYQLNYDEHDNVIELSNKHTKYIFEYDEYGVRTKSYAYNTSGELEYYLTYEYSYY